MPEQLGGSIEHILNLYRIMSAGSFKQDSLGWRIDLFKQKCGEWIEYQLSRLDFDRQPNSDIGGLELLWQVIKFCLWSIIAILLVWITWQLWLFLRPYWRRWQREERYIVSPSPTPMSATDWVERSQSARVDGNYRQAIFYLYQAMLRLLDERGIVSFEPSLTDEEYRRSLLRNQISSSDYELLFSVHQRLCFSNAKADRALFEQCQQAYKQIAET